ncbi:MAG TPA: hypothetical protein VFL80_09375 [Thermoanaerobaculia bacterium]|nr:hypothetical protein [Thermoanaerobaculia bacterium]
MRRRESISLDAALPSPSAGVGEDNCADAESIRVSAVKMIHAADSARSAARVVETLDAAAEGDLPAVMEHAAVVADHASDVALEAEDLLADTPAASLAPPSTESVQRAAVLVEEASAVVLDAARVVQDAAAAITEHGPPAVERRRRERRPQHHHVHARWHHVALYSAVLLGVTLLGALALWRFMERQSLRIVPDEVPKVTLVTSAPSSRSTAAWVRLLEAAGVTANIVPVDKLDRPPEILFLSELQAISAADAARIERFARESGAVVIAGHAPHGPVGPIRFTTEPGMADSTFRLAEASSPLLARLPAGGEMHARPEPVAFLTETPDMVIDARWRNNARAVIAHLEHEPVRYLWVGFDPAGVDPSDQRLRLLIRTAMRWAGGQAISEGAAGATALTFSSAARNAARERQMVFSAERLSSGRHLAITVVNRGTAALLNPAVRVWLPRGVERATLGGDLFMRRGVALAPAPHERTCLLTIRELRPGERRVIKVRLHGS